MIPGDQPIYVASSQVPRATRTAGPVSRTRSVSVQVTCSVPPGTSTRYGVFRADVPGGTLQVTWTDTDRVLLTGPAVLVAQGTWLDAT